MLRKNGIALTVAIAVAALGAPSAQAGIFSVGCNSAGFAKIDPIFSFGQESHHMHVFKGNKAIAANSTHGQLRSSTWGANCTRSSDLDKPGHGDMSSYWAPALMQHGPDGTSTPVSIVNQATYYRVTYHDSTQVQPFPPGIKLLAGNPDATGDQFPTGTRWVRWECRNGSYLVRYQGGGLECVDPDPTQGGPPSIQLRAFFPSCWDGEDPLDAATQPGLSVYDDTPHVKYPVWQSGTGWVCPSGYGTPLPMVELIVGFQTAGGPNVHLSNHNEWGEHADFFEAWDPAVMEKLVRNCLRPYDKNCGGGDGDLFPDALNNAIDSVDP